MCWLSAETKEKCLWEQHLADDMWLLVASSSDTTESTFTKSNDDEGELDCC